MKIQAFSTLGEISHFAISGYFVISGFDITGVYCISKTTRSKVGKILRSFVYLNEILTMTINDIVDSDLKVYPTTVYSA